MAPKENCFTCNFITTLENAMKDTKKYKVKRVWNKVSPVSEGKVFILLFEIIFSLETLFTPLEMHMSI